MEINLEEIIRRFARVHPRIMNWPISPIILVELGSLFEIARWFQYYFPEKFRCYNLTYERENFCDSSLHHIFVNPKILGHFSFFV